MTTLTIVRFRDVYNNQALDVYNDGGFLGRITRRTRDNPSLHQGRWFVRPNGLMPYASYHALRDALTYLSTLPASYTLPVVTPHRKQP